MKKRLKGSYTVETALVLPLLLFCLIGLLALTMFLHDKICILAMLNQELTRGEVLSNRPVNLETGEVDYQALSERGPLYLLSSKEKQEEQIREDMQKQLDETYLFLIQISQIEVEMTLFQLKIKLTPELPAVPFGELFLKEEEWEKTFTLPRPAELVRAFGDHLPEQVEEELPLEEQLESAEEALGSE